jgi:N-acetylglucosamine repressor
MHGIGVCAPGLVNDRLGEIVFCPNLHLLDKRNPARDLEARLAVKAVLLQEIDGLCLSEWMYGVARSLNDFALLDVSIGLGMGVMCSGRLLGGRSGMAGELGHITVNPNGVRCGCGNHGCLETLATDTALVRLISEKDGISRSLNEVATALDERPAAYEHEVRTTSEYLAIAIAAAINVCNPTMLFVHGTLLVANEERFARVLELVKNRTLTASLAECTIVPTKSSKRQAAIAGIMHHLTSDWAPAIP